MSDSSSSSIRSGSPPTASSYKPRRLCKEAMELHNGDEASALFFICTNVYDQDQVEEFFATCKIQNYNVVRNWKSALQVACESSNFIVVFTLLEKGVNPNTTFTSENKHWPALEEVVKHFDPKLIEEFIRRGAINNNNNLNFPSIEDLQCYYRTNVRRETLTHGDIFLVIMNIIDSVQVLVDNGYKLRQDHLDRLIKFFTKIHVIQVDELFEQAKKKLTGQISEIAEKEYLLDATDSHEAISLFQFVNAQKQIPKELYPNLNCIAWDKFQSSTNTGHSLKYCVDRCLGNAYIKLHLKEWSKK